jgi:G:T-mismatch repair DNA endonuclease (very short patch repair protein)
MGRKDIQMMNEELRIKNWGFLPKRESGYALQSFHPKNENSEWVNPFNNEDAKTSFERQKRKIKLAEKNGFKVLEIWSDESNNIEKCLEFIN